MSFGMLRYKKEVAEYKRRRDEIKAKTGQFLSARFGKFDTIFVRFMELQMSYFSQSHQLSKQFIPHVKSYRSKHPRRRPSNVTSCLFQTFKFIPGFLLLYEKIYIDNKKNQPWPH